MRRLLFDLRFAIRGLRRAPVFAAVAIGSLAIGIGANTAVFSVFNSVLIRPFPYPQPDRLAAVFETNPRRGIGRMQVCPPDFLEWRDQVKAFRTAAAYRAWDPNLTGVDQPERLTGLRVTGDFFTTIGTEPAEGRVLLRQDETGRALAVVVSDRLWRRTFATDPELVGRSLQLDGTDYIVVGIMPPSFRFPDGQVDVWAPLNLETERQDQAEHSLRVVSRLQGDGSWPQARAELRSLMATHEAQNDGGSADVASLRDWHVGPGNRRLLWLLLGAVGLLLLTACANVANLLLARGTARGRELFVRTAIGATRGRLVAQLVTESLVLAIAAGALGVLLALWSSEALVALLPPESVYRLSPPSIDWRVLLFTAGVSTFAGLVFGVMPALRHSRTELTALRTEARGSSFPVRATLLGAQAALAVVLLAGAGLLTRAFLHVWHTDAGFSSADVIAARINLPGTLPDARRVAFFDQVIGRLQQNPAVAAVGAVTHVPLSGDGNSGYITIEGREDLSANPGTRPGAARLIATPGYFPTLSIAVRHGRVFTERDDATAPAVAVVNEAMARRHWPGDSPLGKRIKRGTPAAPFPWMTVVGIVADVKQQSLTSPAAPTVYLPLAQSAEAAMTIVARGSNGAAALPMEIRSAVRAVDSQQPIAWTRSLDEVVFGSLGSRWLPMMWMLVFASLALVLATVGVYGVVAYAVDQRRREFGIRLALGANRRSLIRLALGHGLMPSLAGTAVGLVAAVLLARANAALLVGVAPLDLSAYLGAAAALALAALAASYPPARRIADADAALTLRSE